MNTTQHDWDPDEQAALDGLESQLAVIRRRHQADPSFELLRAAQAGALPPDLQEAVAEHIAASPMSRTLAEGLDADEPTLTPEEQDRLLARIVKESKKAADTSSSWGWLRPAFVGAGVLALAAMLWFIRPETPERLAPPTTTVVIAEPSPVPAFLLPFDKPDVRLGMAALTWRGSTGKDNALLADLKPGLDAYRSGDYQTADRELTTLAARYPGTIEILFYQGLSRLFTNDTAGAITALTAAEHVGDTSFATDVAWYRAVAEQRAGHAADARMRLDALCQSNGDGAPRACAAVKQLEAASTPR